MARFLILPSHIVSSILGAGSWLLRARALTADEPPTAQAVMVLPVTLSGPWASIRASSIT